MEPINIIFILLLITSVIIVVTWIAFGSHSKPSPPPQRQGENIVEIIVETLDEEPEQIGGDFITRVSGITFHATENYIGAFVGVIVPEPDNPFDRNAIAIYIENSKKIGYIGKDEQKEYKEWSNDKPRTCVGYIDKNEGRLYGRVKAIKPYNAEYVEDETRKYLRWAIKNYGRQFVPVHLIQKYNL